MGQNRLVVRMESGEVANSSVREEKPPGRGSNPPIETFLNIMRKRAAVVPRKGVTGKAQINAPKKSKEISEKGGAA